MKLLRKASHNIIMLGCLLSLSGCMTPQQIAARQAEQQAAFEDEVNRQHTNYCLEKGLKPKTKKFNQCMADLNQKMEDYFQDQINQQALANQQKNVERQIRNQCSTQAHNYVRSLGALTTEDPLSMQIRMTNECIQEQMAVRSGNGQNYYQSKQLEIQRQQLEIQRQQMQQQQMQQNRNPNIPVTTNCRRLGNGSIECTQF